MSEETNQQNSSEETEASSNQGQSNSNAEDNRLGYERRRADKAERELAALKRERMSESERYKVERDEANQRAEAAEKRHRETTKKTEFYAAARNAGIHDAEAAYALSRDGLDLDENDNLLGGDKAIQALKKSRPYLFTDGGRLGTSGGNVPPPSANRKNTNSNINNWILRQAGR